MRTLFGIRFLALDEARAALPLFAFARQLKLVYYNLRAVHNLTMIRQGDFQLT